MNRVTDLLSSMRTSGVRLWVDRGQLRCRALRGLLTAEQVGLLRERRHEIIAALTLTQNTDADAVTRARQSMSEPAPLAIQQDPDGKSFHKYANGMNAWVRCALRLRWIVDVDVLRKSVATVVRRHESLRTRIIVVDGMPKQQIDAPNEDPLELVKLSAESGDDVENDVRRSLEKLFTRHVDLGIGPLFEIKLFQLDEQDYVLAVTIDRILCDGASLALLLGEIWVAYRDLLHRRQSSLSKISMQYADYAAWQQSRRPYWLAGNDTYWEVRLFGAVRTHLMKDSGLETVKRLSVAILPVSFGKTLSSALQNLASRERTTLGFVVLALCAATLSCWCDQRDFIVPVIVSGRHRPEHVNLIGSLAHALPLRIQLSGDETFMDLLHIVSQEFFAAHEHIESYVHIELAKLADSSQLPDLYRGLWFNWVPPELEDTDPPFGVEPFPVEVPLGSFVPAGEIGLSFSNTTQGICGHGVYRADLLTANTVQRFLQLFREIAENVANDPHARVTHVPNIAMAISGVSRFADGNPDRTDQSREAPQNGNQ